MLKRLVTNLLLLTGTVLVTLVLGELLVRQFVPPDYSAYPFPQGYFVKDEVLGFDISRNAGHAVHHIDDGVAYDFWSNSLGCFDDEYQGEDYMLVLGDSFTWGHVDFENRWANRLERLTGRRMLKCAVSGTGTRGQFLKAKKIIARTGKKPSAMIVGYFIGNDVLDDYLFPQRTVIDGYMVNQRFVNTETGEVIHKDLPEIEQEYRKRQKRAAARERRVATSRIRSLKAWLASNSSIYQLVMKNRQLRALFSRLGLVDPVRQAAATGKATRRVIAHMLPAVDFVNEDADWAQQAWASHLDVIATFKTYADANDIALVFVLIPFREQIYPSVEHPIRGDPLRLNTLLAEFLTRHDIAFVDLYSGFMQAAGKQEHVDSLRNRLYYIKDKHWTWQGHRLAADLVHAYLEERQLLDVQ